MPTFLLAGKPKDDLDGKDAKTCLPTGRSNEIFATNIPVRYHTDPVVVAAKESELEKWKIYEAFDEVDFHEDQHVLSSRWVVTLKSESVVKARLCVRGFEEMIHPQSDSPTASNDSFKLFLSIAANEKFPIRNLDVTSAFLQGAPLERDVYMEPPKEAKIPGKIWKLKKSAYGLYDASRKWFLAVKEELMTIGMKALSGDEAFFTLTKAGRMIGACILHVDDFLLAGNPEFENLLNNQLKGRFTFGKVEDGQFKFTGLNIEQKEDGVYVDQIDYIQSLEPIAITRNGKDEDLKPSEFKAYRALTGQLSWASENTRPDIAFDVRELATRNKSATLEDLKTANKVLKKAQFDDVKVKYSHLGSWEDLKILGYTDSSYKNAELGTKSVGGRVIFLTDGKGNISPLGWKSKTIQQVCKSVKSAETRSLDLGMEDSIFLAQMFHEVYTGQTKGQIDVQMKIDSQTLLDSIKSTKQVEEKTIRQLIAWIKQQKEENTVKRIDWVQSGHMIADVFTKTNVKTDDILTAITEGKLIYEL